MVGQAQGTGHRQQATDTGTGTGTGFAGRHKEERLVRSLVSFVRSGCTHPPTHPPTGPDALESAMHCKPEWAAAGRQAYHAIPYHTIPYHT